MWLISVRPKLFDIAHCSYLDVYISRKIRLCVVDLEDQFQSKLIIFFTWKFRSVILIFLLFFAGIVKSTAFYTLLLLFQRVDIFELRFDAKIVIQIPCQLIIIAATVCKKQWIWQILQKIEIKWLYIIDMNFQTKKVMDLACRGIDLH